MKVWHAIALLCCVVLLAYYPVLFVPLNQVDDVRMATDLLNRPGFTAHDFFIPTSKSFFRPLINSSFIIDLFLWNLEASFLHLENLLIHLGCTILVFFLIQQVARLSNVNGLIVPFVAALVFGVHPVNTEAVIWIAGRADLIAGFFILLTLKLTFSYFEKNSWYWLVCISFAFILGCFAKETALFLWPGLFLLGLAFRDKSTSFKHQFKAFFPAVICIFSISLYFLLRSIALRGRDLGISHVDAIISNGASGGEQVAVTIVPGSYSFLDLIERALTVSGFYLGKLIQPFPLNFGIVDIPPYYFWLGVLLTIFCIFLLWRLTLPAVFFLTAVCLGSVALLVAYGEISWTPVAERYMYAPVALASGGGALVVGQFCQSKGPFRRNPVLYLIVFVLLVISATSVYQRAKIWQDNVVLFEDTIKKSPNFQMAHNELALALMSRGERARAMNILRNLEVSELQVASLNKVEVWIEEGSLEKAREYLLKRMNNPGAYRRVILDKLVKTVGMLHAGATDQHLAETYLEEQLSYLKELWHSTQDPFYQYRIGRLQMYMGDIKSAQKSFEKAYQAFPESSLYKQPAGKLAESLKLP